MDGPLPEPYARWLGEMGIPWLPGERRATCGTCAMTAEHGGVPAAQAFSPDVKCCTFQPELPNFRVGQILDDPGAVEASALAWIRARIEAGTAITPLGMFRDAAEDQRTRAVSADGAYGRTPAARCPMYVEDGGRCGIWRFREAACSTFFCKHERGAVGRSFWVGVRLLLAHVEKALSLRAALDLIPGVEASDAWLHLSLELGRRDRTRADQMLAAPATQATLWGPWLDRKEAYFVAAARHVVALSWAEVAAIGGAELGWLSRVVAQRHLRLADVSLPAAVRPAPGAQVHASERADRATLHVAAHPFDTIDVPVENLRRAASLRSLSGLDPAQAAEVRTLLDYGFLEPDR